MFLWFGNIFKGEYLFYYIFIFGWLKGMKDGDWKSVKISERFVMGGF